MNTCMEEYGAIDKFVSHISGWLYQSKVRKILLPCLLVAVQTTVIASQVLLMLKHSDNIDMIIEGITFLVMATGIIAKVVNIVANDDKLQCLLRLMNDHWSIFNSESELHILRYYADIGRKVTKYYTVYAYTTLVQFVMIPLIPRVLDIVKPLNESRPLIYLYEAEYGIDKEKYYYPILLHNCVGCTIMILVLINVDTLNVVCVLHACGLFAATGNRLENINSKVDNETNVDKDSSCRLFTEERDSVGDDYLELLTCLKKHQLALEYVKIMDAVFTYAALVLLILNLITASVIGIQMINKFKEGVEIIRYGCIMIGVLVHLMFMCFPGQLLIDRSSEVFDKTYNSRWYIFSSRSRRLLRILLYRSLVPSTITAGKTYVMSMSMYSMVMKTAMSYFTTILSLK